MYDLRAILKRLKFPITTTLAGRLFHSRIILTKKEYCIYNNCSSRVEVRVLKGLCWFSVTVCLHVYFVESNPFLHFCVRESDLCF